MTGDPPPDAITAALRDSFGDLARNRIRGAALDAFEAFVTAPGALTQPSLLVRCRIGAGEPEIRVVVDKPISRWRLGRCFVPFLRRALPAVRGRAEFFALISDTLHVPAHLEPAYAGHLRRVPLLRCDRSATDPVSLPAILMPDFFMQDNRYGAELREIGEAVRAHPFDRRRDVIMWRGSLSGPDYPTPANYRSFPRFQLCRLALQHPDVLDARLCNYDVGDAALSGFLEQEYGAPAETLPAAGFVPYKYLISLDGVGAAWKRTATILASGAVLLLHHRWTQFFYPGLRPGVHYVPVAFDFSDLIDRYEWLAAHPERARQIAENGRRFARRVLTPPALEAYFAQVLTLCGEFSEP
ncbi:glycosyl transferase family 90 [Actinoplanes sp. NPDC049599]|uniref:glycosyl transferase family 90 n=1 Tax=Actinoplanes sp. NPDC049599 TaxID=3363903 RepID=UPI0037AC7F4C